MKTTKVFIVMIVFYRGDGIHLKVWSELKGIFTNKLIAELFIERIKENYERVDFIIKEVELNKELIDL